ncbi:MAG: type II secretion system GspH family protein [Oscillospiraceae bacterium]|nr:type II secretion system GspH family protein [Oscillospiraceae bacterium]
MMKLFRKLKNKKGFTLVELLVSVAIFAVIISPLIHAFLSATDMSRKSHYLGDATLASRNIIETVKARGAWETIDNPLILGNAVACDCLLQVHTFHLMGYSAGMSTFDVTVTFDADEFSDINNMQIADYSPMDGVFAQSVNEYENPDILAADYLATQVSIHSGVDLTAEQVRLLYSREILIKVHQTAAEDRITVTYTYGYAGYTYTRDYEFYRAARTATEETKSVYVFYQPIYFRHDNITIDNSAGMDLKLFLAAQNLNIAGYTPVISGDSTVELFTNADGGELVSRSQHDRMFKITVDVYEKGVLEQGGRRMLRIEAAKLD